MEEFLIRVRGDVVVSVPNSLGFLTTYVLLEQEDWFEKEIPFVRKALQPGMQCIDIGANYGIYALAMAKAVMPGGSVVAFEPTAATAAALDRSIAANAFDNIRVVRAALSATEGRRAFFTYPNSELNSFTEIKSSSVPGEVEQVEVSTLDRLQLSLGDKRIDFVKIDAEGEEAKILAGGEVFFRTQSPLVMFEVVIGAGSQREVLLPLFQRMGYDIYRLIGPSEFLVPASFSATTDSFDYNFFACKPDRAARMAAAGLLVREISNPRLPQGIGQAFFRRQPYARAFGAPEVKSASHGAAFDAYAMWRDQSLNLADRAAALRASYVAIQAAAQERPSIARLSTLARIACEMAKREQAATTARNLGEMLSAGRSPPDEPFLPADARYDTFTPQHARQWLIAATMQACEEWGTPSGYFIQVPAQRLNVLDWLQTTPYASASLERRRQLQRIRAGLQQQRLPTPMLTRATSDNLNPALWTGQG